MADVLIVGAGPTGLVLAISLVKQGLTVRIIDQLQEPMHQSRALALQSRTLELFEKMGLLPSFLAVGRKIKRAHFYLQQETLFQVDISQLEIPHPFVLSLPQEETEAILEKELLALGIKVERGVALRRVMGQKAIVTLPDGREEEVTARWICGCDGAHSVVRHSLGLSFKGAPFQEQFWLSDLLLDAPLSQEEASIFFRKDEIVALFPLPKPSWYRVIIGARKKQEGSEEQILKQMGLESRQRGWTSAFSIHRRLVSKMQQDCCFLLGDAAHIHSPVGGQGLNTGVQDAYNLAWKLALVQKGLGKEALLKSFHQERYPVAKAVLRYTTRATSLVLSTTFIKRYARLLAFLFKKTSIQKKVAQGISEMALAYKKSPMIDYTPIPGILVGPGERAPDGILPDGSRLFQHLCHPLHTLICFGECEEVKAVIEERYEKCIALLQLPCISLYCTRGNSFYLVRPDGYVAFCGAVGDERRLIAYLERIFFFEPI